MLSPSAYRVAMLTAVLFLAAGCSSARESPAVSQGAASLGPAPTAAAVPSSSPVPQVVPAITGAWAITETLTKDPQKWWDAPVGTIELRTWTFTPTCTSGPCDLDVVSTHVGAAASTGLPLHWAQAGGTYTNSYSWSNPCGSIKDGYTMTTVSKFTVVSASTDGSQATEIDGTQLNTAKASAACLAGGGKDEGGVEYDLRGVPAKG